MSNYRLEIDGLRGVSVILVILFHAKIPFFSGGFFGVDIFFVISGYLITSIILNLYRQKKFFLFKFYERRIRRIIPALYVMLFFLLFYNYFLQAPYFSKDLSQSIFFTPIFFQNFLNIIEGANYFNLSYDLKSLGHTWSLSIEEQFYFIYPLIVIFFFKSPKYFLYKFLIILFIMSLFLYIYLGVGDKYVGYHFFLTPSRIWEILFGCILAYQKLNFKNKNLFPAVGMFLILSSAIAQNFISQPLIFRVFIVIGTGLLLISTFENKEFIIGKILKNRILVFFGLISYSLYLWHVPIYSIYRDFFSFNVNIYANLILISITIIISYISYRFIETPFRKSKKISSTFIYSFFLIGLLIFPIYGYFGHISDGFEKKKVSYIKNENRKYYISFKNEKDKLSKFKPKKINSDDNILVIGDSLASDVVNSLNTQNIKSTRYNLNAPCFKKLLKSGFACKKNLEDLVYVASKSKSVIIASDFGNESSEPYAVNLYDFLKNKKIKSKIVGGLNFSYVSSDSFRYAKFDFYRNQDVESFYYNNIQPNIFKGNNLLKEEVGDDYIDKFKFICDSNIKKCKMFTNTYEPIFYDTKHLTVIGYYKFGEYLNNKI
jgi:peptidoglycan/LPS O-acetylase OafA/YrhL